MKNKNKNNCKIQLHLIFLSSLIFPLLILTLFWHQMVKKKKDLAAELLLPREKIWVMKESHWAWHSRQRNLSLVPPASPWLFVSSSALDGPFLKPILSPTRSWMTCRPCEQGLFVSGLSLLSVNCEGMKLICLHVLLVAYFD